MAGIFDEQCAGACIAAGLSDFSKIGVVPAYGMTEDGSFTARGGKLGANNSRMICLHGRGVKALQCCNAYKRHIQ